MSCQISPLFSENMVLQRERPLTIHGRADTPVTVTIQGQRHTAQPDEAGRFSVTLEPLAAGGPFAMTINEHQFQQVYVGDVWLCGGQSNMELPMNRVKYRFPDDMENPCPHIHAFIVPQETDFHAPREDLCGGHWRRASAKTVGEFSAVGYFFAKMMTEKLGVPIGLLMAAVGGTPIHAWMDRDALADYPDLLALADRCGDDAYVAATLQKDGENMAAYNNAIRQNDPGLSEQWFDPRYDDSSWEEQDLLTPWTGCGSVWWRKNLTLPPSMAGQPGVLFLGTLIDADEVYLNGELIGGTGYRYPPRVYSIPALPSGSVNITVRVTAADGGCFTKGKQYRLSTAAGSVDLQGAWRFRKGGEGKPCPAGTTFGYMPTGLFHAMIHPLRRYAINGALWYQGESDAGNPAPYAHKFTKMAALWRSLWGWNFPLVTVELAHWEGGKSWDALRRAQRQILSLPQTAMAAAFDAGEHNDLHPQDKRTIGERMARCALTLAHQKPLVPSPFEIIEAK